MPDITRSSCVTRLLFFVFLISIFSNISCSMLYEISYTPFKLLLGIMTSGADCSNENIDAQYTKFVADMNNALPLGTPYEKIIDYLDTLDVEYHYREQFEEIFFKKEFPTPPGCFVTTYSMVLFTLDETRNLQDMQFEKQFVGL